MSVSISKEESIVCISYLFSTDVNKYIQSTHVPGFKISHYLFYSYFID